MAIATSLTEKTDEQKAITEMVRQFVDNEVIPIAEEHDHEDKFPEQVVEQMKELGLFGVTIPEEYGGMGLDLTTYAMIVEELSRGWISISGVVNTHFIGSYLLMKFGTDEQKEKFLPRMARHERARPAERLAPARAGGRARRVAVAHARVEAVARHHDVRVAAVRVDGDPLAGTAMAPVHQHAAGQRGAQEAAPVKGVGDGTRAVIAAIEAAAAIGRVPAAVDVRLLDDAVGRCDHLLDAQRRGCGRNEAAVHERALRRRRRGGHEGGPARGRGRALSPRAGREEEQARDRKRGDKQLFTGGVRHFSFERLRG